MHKIKLLIFSGFLAGIFLIPGFVLAFDKEYSEPKEVKQAIDSLHVTLDEGRDLLVQMVNLKSSLFGEAIGILMDKFEQEPIVLAEGEATISQLTLEDLSYVKERDYIWGFLSALPDAQGDEKNKLIRNLYNNGKNLSLETIKNTIISSPSVSLHGKIVTVIAMGPQWRENVTGIVKECTNRRWNGSCRHWATIEGTATHGGIHTNTIMGLGDSSDFSLPGVPGGKGFFTNKELVLFIEQIVKDGGCYSTDETEASLCVGEKNPRVVDAKKNLPATKGLLDDAKNLALGFADYKNDLGEYQDGLMNNFISPEGQAEGNDLRSRLRSAQSGLSNCRGDINMLPAGARARCQQLLDAAKAAQDALDKWRADQMNLLSGSGLSNFSSRAIEQKSLRDLLDVKISPSNPGPNEPVSITVESYLSDLQKAMIMWSKNGKKLQQGIGKTKFSFQNGPSGEITKISMTLITNTGISVTREFSFNPVGVTILWEADTYTPPFYKGKALMSTQAFVRVAAIPDKVSTGTSGAGNLVYNWEKNGNIDQSASGYQKNIFAFNGPIPLTRTNVRLQVSSIDDSINSEMHINIPLIDPIILFYEKRPLDGVWYNNSITKEFDLSKKEISINAEPYFFSNERIKKSNLEYGWALNGSVIKNQGNVITLRNDKNIKGSSNISLKMINRGRTFQRSSAGVKMNVSEKVEN